MKKIQLSEAQLHKIIKKNLKKLIKEDTTFDLDGKEMAVQEAISAIRSIPTAIQTLTKLQKALEIMPQLAQWYQEYEEELGDPMWPVDNLDVLQQMPSELSSIQETIGELSDINTEACEESLSILQKVVGSTLGKDDYLNTVPDNWYKRNFDDGTNSEEYVNQVNDRYRGNLNKLRNFNL